MKYFYGILLLYYLSFIAYVSPQQKIICKNAVERRRLTAEI